jgi:hypothetical protein
MESIAESRLARVGAFLAHLEGIVQSHAAYDVRHRKGDQRTVQPRASLHPMTTGASPIIYEVNLVIDEAIASAYDAWLLEHMKEMLTFTGFIKAQRFSRLAAEEGGSGEDTSRLWTVQYWVETREHLEEYFRTQAPRMREEGLKRFPGQFKASRRILYPLLEA